MHASRGVSNTVKHISIHLRSSCIIENFTTALIFLEKPGLFRIVAYLIDDLPAPVGDLYFSGVAVILFSNNSTMSSDSSSILVIAIPPSAAPGGGCGPHFLGPDPPLFECPGDPPDGMMTIVVLLAIGEHGLFTAKVAADTGRNFTCDIIHSSS